MGAEESVLLPARAERSRARQAAPPNFPLLRQPPPQRLVQPPRHRPRPPVADLAAVEAALERDNFMTADAAKDFGLIDQVLIKRPEPAAQPT